MRNESQMKFQASVATKIGLDIFRFRLLLKTWMDLNVIREEIANQCVNENAYTRFIHLRLSFKKTNLCKKNKRVVQKNINMPLVPKIYIYIFQ